ncbi:TIGR04282 family arsenosugar biosynthesis glycosyltransferase [soil metagenome]
MESVAVAVICKTPTPGRSKTRLSPPLLPEECAEISACFIADLCTTIGSLERDGAVAGYAVYTPAGSEATLRRLLPDDFGLVLQVEGDFGARLERGIADLIALGHRGAILINSDSPTLPRAVLRAAVDAVLSSDAVVLGPANDGGYTLIGLSTPQPHLFTDIPWSTEVVYELTVRRAQEIGLPVIALDPWYDVDDAGSYAMLERELDGIAPDFAASMSSLQDAPRTRAFVDRRRAAARSS